ncbi:MAG: PAS domain-containing protein [Methylocystis sp.]
MSDVKLMQAFFDSVDAALYVKDEKGRFLLVNRKAAEELNCSEAECIGKSDYDFLPKEQAEQVISRDRQVREKGAPVDYEITIDLPGGKRTVRDHKFAILIPGHPGAVAGIAIDV